MIKRANVEDKLLRGIKEQLLEPAFVKAVTKRIRAEARKGVASNIDVTHRVKKLDHQIRDLAETICEVGRSDILTAKLRELEAERQRLDTQISRASSPAKLLPGAADKWREIVSNLGNLKNYATHDEIGSARESIREIVGEVVVLEKDSHVFAYTKLNENMGLNSGAEKRT
jgi:hypothetical protein